MFAYIQEKHQKSIHYKHYIILLHKINGGGEGEGGGGKGKGRDWYYVMLTNNSIVSVQWDSWAMWDGWGGGGGYVVLWGSMLRIGRTRCEHSYRVNTHCHIVTSI